MPKRKTPSIESEDSISEEAFNELFDKNAMYAKRLQEELVHFVDLTQQLALAFRKRLKTTDDDIAGNKKPAIDKKDKIKREPTHYNIFVKRQVEIIKSEDPSIDHREAWKMAATRWTEYKTTPEYQIEVETRAAAAPPIEAISEPIAEEEPEPQVAAADDTKDTSIVPDAEKKSKTGSSTTNGNKKTKQSKAKQPSDCVPEAVVAAA